MGVMKRIEGLRQSGELIPRCWLVFAEVVPPRGPPPPAPKPAAAAVPAEPPWDVEAEPPAPGWVELYDLRGDGREPRPAAPGWYSVGQTFYRSGSGPCPEFGADAPPPVVPVAEKPGRARQLDLF